VGLAYRELIGSLYESWTIGIERVYKWLTYNIIQRHKKWQKEGFEAKEKGINDEGRMTNDEGNVVKISSFTHTPLSRCTYPAIAGYLEEGECSESFIGKAPEPPKGDKLEKETNLLPYTYFALERHIFSYCWLPSKKGN